MALAEIFSSGRSALAAARAGISTSGHNISNATTEGFSRQRVTQTAEAGVERGTRGLIGQGVRVSGVQRANDGYIEKQLRIGGRDLATAEEKDLILRQTEDIFNEMNGEGLNRVISRFFNDFRKLSNEPDNEAIRQAVRESSGALANDFKRIRGEMENVRRHIDSRLEGSVAEVNSLAKEISMLNEKIRLEEIRGVSPNDLLDKRDLALKNLAANIDVNTYSDSDGNVLVDLRGAGPLVQPGSVRELEVHRVSAREGDTGSDVLDIFPKGAPEASLLTKIKSGKIGALIESRDAMVNTVVDRLDHLAYSITNAVNEIHRQGFTRDGAQGVNFFKPLATSSGASQFFDLSSEVRRSSSNIAAAAVPNAPSDNRIALAISGLQGLRIVNDGKSTLDDFYNSIVSDVGVASARNKTALNQNKDIMNQLGKMRDNISGVSIDEETTQLMQYQHSFDASARLIKVANEMLTTILSLKD